MNWKVENDVREARPAAGPRPASPLTCSCHVGRGGTQREPASHQIGGRGALRPLGRGKAHAARAFEVPNRRGKGSVRVRKRVCSRSRYDKVIARRWRGSTRTQICSRGCRRGTSSLFLISRLQLFGESKEHAGKRARSANAGSSLAAPTISVEGTPGGTNAMIPETWLKQEFTDFPTGFTSKIGVFPAGRNPAGSVLPPQTQHVSQGVDDDRAIANVRAFRGPQETA